MDDIGFGRGFGSSISPLIVSVVGREFLKRRTLLFHLLLLLMFSTIYSSHLTTLSCIFG